MSQMNYSNQNLIRIFMSPMRVSCSSYLILIDCITLIIFVNSKNWLFFRKNSSKPKLRSSAQAAVAYP